MLPRGGCLAQPRRGFEQGRGDNEGRGCEAVQARDRGSRRRWKKTWRWVTATVSVSVLVSLAVSHGGSWCRGDGNGGGWTAMDKDIVRLYSVVS